MSNTKKVKKLWGSFPETIRMRGMSVQFNAEGVAEVPAEVAEFLAAELSHEYVVADADGKFVMPTSEDDEAPKRREITDEERDMRGELARLRAEVPELIERLEKAEQGNARLAAENAELAKENESLRNELVALRNAPPAAPAAPAENAASAAPAAPTSEAPAAPAAPKRRAPAAAK